MSSPSIVTPLSRLLYFFFRPSLWVCLIAIVAYWDATSLRGSYVYDDAGSLKNNPVVTGQVPWTQVATRDFWGTNMTLPQSHKSFRPLTTLTFRWNWILSEHYLGTNGTDDHTLGFHLVNVGLHGINSGLVTEVAAFAFEDISCGTGSLLSGILFALHPVHAEAVSNMTSRGELLMSFFFLLAFLSFASHLPGNISNRNPSVIFLYVVPWVCMTLSLFCKEQGVTTLMSLVAYDFLTNHDGSLRRYLSRLFSKEPQAIAFARRTFILGIQTLVVAIFRYWLNGETTPDFIYDQNPAGFSQDRLTRVLSVSWVYCLYIWDAIYPSSLCPDWSGRSIDLITHISDPRVGFVILLWGHVATCLLLVLVRVPSKTQQSEKRIRMMLMAFFCFTFFPFLLSSNILVVVGLMKADRVIYLPLLGFCLLEGFVLQEISFHNKSSTSTQKQPRLLPGTAWWSYLLVMLQLFWFAGRVHERNIAWSHSLNLWMSAYQINPRSYHTMYNCGYELSLKQRYAESEQVLRPLADPRVDGPGNSFVYAMVLFNLQRCDEALEIVDDALEYVEELRIQGGRRNTEDKLKRHESNLYVARAYCTKDTAQAGKWMYEAVQKDTTNRYAIDQAQAMVNKVQALMGQRMQGIPAKK